jgi:transposase
MHKSREAKAKVESYAGKLRLYFLPPYILELNPDERVW